MKFNIVLNLGLQTNLQYSWEHIPFLFGHQISKEKVDKRQPMFECYCLQIELNQVDLK